MEPDEAYVVVRDISHALITLHDPTLVADRGILFDDKYKQQQHIHIGTPNRMDTHPYLQTLMHFDTREFLNVLSLAFGSEQYVNNDWGYHMRMKFIQILISIVYNYAKSVYDIDANVAQPRHSPEVHLLVLDQIIYFRKLTYLSTLGRLSHLLLDILPMTVILKH
jgi:hypothetical protein